MPIDYDSYEPKADSQRPAMKWLDVGDSIQGEVIDARDVKTNRGDVVLVYGIRSQDGSEWDVWASTMDLEQQLYAHRVQEGDTVAITFTEFKATASGNMAKLFDIKVEKRQSGSATPVATDNGPSESAGEERF